MESTMGLGVLAFPLLLRKDFFVSLESYERAMHGRPEPIRSFAARPHSRQQPARTRDAPFSNLSIQQGLVPK